MPRYFIHMVEGEEQISDEEGLDLPDLAAAENKAILGAQGLINDAVDSGRRDYSGRFRIENERGEAVLGVSFSAHVSITTFTPIDDRARSDADVNNPE